MNVKRDIRFRVYIAFTAMCLLGVAILLKAAWMQVDEGPKLRAMAKNMTTRQTRLTAQRGNIYTEKNDLLCSTIPMFDIRVDFSVIDSSLFEEKVDSLAMQLHSLFGNKSQREYSRLLKKAKAETEKYWLLCKNIPYNQYQQLRTFHIFNKGRARGGFIEVPKNNRINPYGMLAYRTIGLWRENAQTVGLEATYDSVLRGHEGSQVEQKMTGGGWMPIEGSVIDPHNGRDIVTTIDLDIQGIAEYAVKDVCEKYNLQYGTCVVMEVATGKIRAMVNLGAQPDGSYFEDFNYAMIPTEPGSVFKLVTLTALFNDKYVDTGKIVDAEGGAVRFGKQVMKDSHLGLGKLKVKDAFAHSSNTAHAKLAYQYYNNKPEQFIAHVKKLHLHEKTGIDLAGERRPNVKTPASKTWSQTTLPWMATGYEVQITPLHTCMLYNAVANNGRMMRPYLVQEVREYGKTIFRNRPHVLEEKIGDEVTVAQLRACAEEVALTGTAKTIKSPFYTIAGKTGTAQVADKGIRYSDGVYQGSFVGYFPADKPKYTIAVVTRTKKHAGSYYGGTVAAPVFRMIADRVFAAGTGWEMPADSLDKKKMKPLVAQKATGENYNVMLTALGKKIQVPERPVMQQLVADSGNRVSVQTPALYKGMVPDVNGMGLKDALYLLEKEGLSVHIKGRGRVRAQSVAPGTIARKGQDVTIELGS